MTDTRFIIFAFIAAISGEAVLILASFYACEAGLGGYCG